MSRATSAIFSACTLHSAGSIDCRESCAGRLYRYVLEWPTGVDNDRMALGIFANPSTADAIRLDPTLKRWFNYCRAWGYGWSVTCNVFPWRSTDPKLVPASAVALGNGNLQHIEREALLADLVVCGWGNLDRGYGAGVLALLRTLGVTPHALKLTKAGNPCHPLYLRSDLKPFPIEARHAHGS